MSRARRFCRGIPESGSANIGGSGSDGLVGDVGGWNARALRLDGGCRSSLIRSPGSAPRSDRSTGCVVLPGPDGEDDARRSASAKVGVGADAAALDASPEALRRNGLPSESEALVFGGDMHLDVIRRAFELQEDLADIAQLPGAFVQSARRVGGTRGDENSLVE